MANPWKQSRTTIYYVAGDGDEWSLTSVAPYGHFRVLPHFPVVRTCRLDVQRPDSVDQAIPLQPHFSLSLFHTLVLSNNDSRNNTTSSGGALDALLSWLTLPASKLLRFSRWSDCPDTICALFDRSRFTLDELAPFEFDLRANVVARVLKNVALRGLFTLRIGGETSSLDGDHALSVSDEMLQVPMWPDVADSGAHYQRFITSTQVPRSSWLKWMDRWGIAQSDRVEEKRQNVGLHT
ncbi:hypothetical protein PM082_014671 [Marasmius tenuissimus]|nr:hypothetical protein PM082_014671 [Marasmius tenuissimus]